MSPLRFKLPVHAVNSPRIELCAQEKMSMPRQFVIGVVVAALTIVALAFAMNLGVAGPQESGKAAPSAGAKSRREASDIPSPPAQNPHDQAKRLAAISKSLEGYDLKPRPPAPIPDEPPPHEGATIGLPYVVEPPDLILVEVLEALPGRPISGERLVRPDGTIDLGFYGQVYVKGLALDQVKVAIIKHLRAYLTDETLGLEARLGAENDGPAPGKNGAAMPSQPTKGENPPDKNEQPRTRASSSFQRELEPRPAPRRSARRPGVAGPIKVRRAAARGPQDEPRDQSAPAQTPNKLDFPPADRGPITITIQVDGQNAAGAGPRVRVVPPPEPATPFGEDEESWIIVPPEQSDMVFVDVTAYNSKHYYVQGDVAISGRMPWTGNETVLDVLGFAGGFMPTAEPKDIRLVRPARGGKPAKVLKVDFEAIQEQGDVTSNYQIFPGDRLIVGRNEVVKRTVEIDRLNAPLMTVTGMMLQEATVLRSLQFATAGDRDELLKEYVDFWAKVVAQKGEFKFDEQTLRDALIRKMKLIPNPSNTTPPK
jgi:protein involved in polysaccharide export with SLBB domain